MTSQKIRPSIISLIALATAACAEPDSPTVPLPRPADYGYTTVFFGFDDASLNATALTGVAHIAKVALEDRTHVCVIGTTDASGSDAYNMDLSRRRAESIRDELVRKGVPTAKVTLQWHGGRQLLVQTKPGEPEAQNRRAVVFGYYPDGKACSPSSAF